MSFPSQIGLPASLKYELPASLSDSCKTMTAHIAPDGPTSVTSPAFTSTAFVANSTGSFGQFTAQNINFSIPCGNSDNVFLDCASTSLSFVLTYSVSTASSATGGSMNLIGSASSFFDQLQVFSNSVPLESINGYGQLFNYLLNNTVSLSERSGGMSVCMGCDSNAFSGIEFPTAVGSYRFSFTIPLISIIGVNCDKFFPVGAVNNLSLQMTTASNFPVASYCTAVATQPVISSWVLSEFYLNMKMVDVGDLAGAMLRQTLQNNKWYIKSQSYNYSNASIPSGSLGNLQLLFQMRNTSLKSFFNTFGISQGAVAPNGYYDSINPCLTSRQLYVSNNYYPMKPINDCARPSEGYTYLIQSLGGSIPKALGTVVNRETYNSILTTAPSGSDSSLAIPAAGLRPTPPGDDNTLTSIISKSPSMFYGGFDLEKSSGILFQGVNTRSAPPYLNLTVGTATTAPVQCNAWGLYDLILEIDVASKSIIAHS